MPETINSHELARRFIAERPSRSAAWSDEIERRHGFDPRKTLTEISGDDAPDSEEAADYREVNALRRVPLDRWTPADILLVLTYDLGGRPCLWLALDCLAGNPLIEAGLQPCDLLVEAARSVSKLVATVDPETAAAKEAMLGVLDLTDSAIWQAFDDRSTELGATQADAALAKNLLVGGWDDDEIAAWWPIVDLLESAAEARALVKPPSVLGIAEAEMLYARYRPGRGIEMVPQGDIATPELRIRIDSGSTSSFRRVTTFDIVLDGARPGVRLRHRAQRPIENWRGIAFADIEIAMGFAESRYGVSRTAWREV
ncbi:MAG: hypothetical protein GEV13_08595 [Rhodospirillales bacterium]|nr:hypothetical protein [Rhodospirillales bacterium]